MELPITVMKVNCILEAIEAAADCVLEGAVRDICLCCQFCVIYFLVICILFIVDLDECLIKISLFF